MKALIVVESHAIWLRVIRGQNHINDEEKHTHRHTHTHTHIKNQAEIGLKLSLVNNYSA